MIDWLWFVIPILGAAPFVSRAARIYLDARARNLSRSEGLRWALMGLAAPDRYWWGRRLEILPVEEGQRLLAQAAQEMSLQSVGNLRCPLCNYEMEGVFTLSADGSLAVQGREIVCARCGFRLDCCRHCRHFVPGSGVHFQMEVDRTQGKCSRIRQWCPVTEVCPPHMSRRLMEMGYEVLRVQAPIRDSYVPVEGCRFFSLDEKGLGQTGAKNIDRKRLGLIQLLQRL